MAFRWMGIAGATAAVLSLAACGGGPTAPLAATPFPNTAAPATLADLWAAVSSPEAGRDLNCRDEVHAQVTLTNRAARLVAVSGVVKTSSVVAGNCTIAPEFTYAPIVVQVFTNSTSVVLDQVLYTNGSGCCRDPNDCSGGTCEFRQTFRVLTEAGEIPAGGFNYKVTFANCAACQTITAAAGALRCPSDAR